MRVPGWLYRPLMWLSQPRRAMIAATALLSCTVAAFASKAAGMPWQVWGDACAVALALALVAPVWRLAARVEREKRRDG